MRAGIVRWAENQMRAGPVGGAENEVIVGLAEDRRIGFWEWAEIAGIVEGAENEGIMGIRKWAEDKGIAGIVVLENHGTVENMPLAEIMEIAEIFKWGKLTQMVVKKAEKAKSPQEAENVPTAVNAEIVERMEESEIAKKVLANKPVTIAFRRTRKLRTTLTEQEEELSRSAGRGRTELGAERAPQMVEGMISWKRNRPAKGTPKMKTVALSGRAPKRPIAKGKNERGREVGAVLQTELWLALPTLPTAGRTRGSSADRER